MWRPEARIDIEDVYPELDGGRYPVKRIVGDQFEVRADLFRDGHDMLRAVVKFAPDGSRNGAKRRWCFSTTTAGSAISASLGSGYGDTRSRPGPISSKAGARMR